MGGGRQPHYGRHQGRARRVLRPLFRRLWQLEVTGLDHVSARGPAILCPNHLAAIDSFVVPAVLEREVIFVGKADYLDDWKTRWLFPALGMIPIDRRGGDHATAALDAARAVLAGGGLFAIYPEGTRSRSGRLYRGHTGAARLAIETGAPIIPIGLVGTDAVQPVDTTRPRFGLPITVNIGSPIDVERYRSRVGDHTVYRELIDEVMFEIRALSGQDYENRYASEANAELAPAAAPIVDDIPTVPLLSSADVLVSRPLSPTA
ncbi:MAG: lysophospholipid acyltransferase family protein [Acidimicrobiales bacterium]